MDYCFGVDIGGTTVKIGLFQTDGVLMDKWEIKTRTENEGEAILPDVAEALKKKMEEKGLKSSQMSGIGIGIPAPVDEEGIVQNTANLGWGYKEVSREMKELTGMKVAAGNDANVAALGEMWLGAGKGHKNMIMVTLGTGVGGVCELQRNRKMRMREAGVLRAVWVGNRDCPSCKKAVGKG